VNNETGQRERDFSEKRGPGADFSPYGTDLFGNPIEPSFNNGELAKRFIFPPFSVLNGREGEWQARKVAWLSLGIRSEVGRGGNLLKYSDTVLQPDVDKRQNRRGEIAGAAAKSSVYLGREGGQLVQAKLAKTFNTTDWIKEKGLSGVPGTDEEWTGTSIFDPVLCELAYRWFCPPGGAILDPFAGGSVRGIVASALGFAYTGVDLRPEQVAANQRQLAEIGERTPLSAPVEWHCGDSGEVLDGSDPETFDFLFTCPPYGDLEVYSDLPEDISTMEFPQFLDRLEYILHLGCRMLKPGRFAAIVVGDFRDGTGVYRNFPNHVVDMFLRAGLQLYNEAILVTAVGSLPIRISGQFEKGRKLGKTHQNFLVFVKGSWKDAGRAVNNGNETS
jgi:DNA modification methylase